MVSPWWQTKRTWFRIINRYRTLINPFVIYSITLNKQRVYDSLAKQKERVYNFIARNVMDKIPVENASTRIEEIIDKSKSKTEIREFNEYLIRHIKGRIDPQDREDN